MQEITMSRARKLYRQDVGNGPGYVSFRKWARLYHWQGIIVGGKLSRIVHGR